MTDQERDDLLDAVLEGAAPAADVARVASDAELSERLVRLQRARAALADVPAAPPSVLDAQIAAALDVFGESGTASPALAPVTTLASRRAVLARPLAAAAALVAAVVLGGVVLSTQLDDGDTLDAAPSTDETSTASDAAESMVAADGDDDSSGGADPSAESAPIAQDSDDTADTTSSDPLAFGDAQGGGTGTAGTTERSYAYGGDLVASSIDDLVAQVHDALDDGAGDETPPDTTPPCAAYGDVRDSFTAVRYEARATVDGRPVLVVVGDADDGTELYVFDRDSCELVHNQRI